MSCAGCKLVVVTPVFEDAEASNLLFRQLATQFGADVFVVAVDDGSVRRPAAIGSLQAAGLSGEILRLRRNVGHQNAIAIGLAHVCKFLQPQQRVVIMDCDGEDLPASIPELLQALAADDIDIAVAERRERMDSWRFRVFYGFYKQIFRLMTGRRIAFGNFMALKAHAAMRLAIMPETSIHVAAATISSRLRTAWCPLNRGPRLAGQSQMNFVSLALHGFKGMMIFAEDVLVRTGVFCALVASLSVVFSIIAVMLKIIGFSTPGWFSIALGVLVLIFLQTGALALVTLLLTGIVRNNAVASHVDHSLLIAEVIAADEPAATTSPAS